MTLLTEYEKELKQWWDMLRVQRMKFEAFHTTHNHLIEDEL